LFRSVGEDGADLVVAFPLVALFVEGALGAVLAAEGDGAPQRPTDDVAVPSAGDAVREAAGELEAHRVALEVDAPACAFELDGEDVAVEIALDVMWMAVAGLDAEAVAVGAVAARDPVLGVVGWAGELADDATHGVVVEVGFGGVVGGLDHRAVGAVAVALEAAVG